MPSNLRSPDAARRGIAIIIKTFNEEARIGRAIESALAVTSALGGEVIVADGGSTDRTIDVALAYPVHVVQLSDRAERCCGVGPQLGYQHSHFRLIYILDGDMELKLPFVREAVAVLEEDADVAGVGGGVVEQRTSNMEFKSRERHARTRQVEHGAPVHCLTGGGLYRRDAIESVSYLSDRNLHGFEEYDLGARLRRDGWRLVRLHTPAVDHYSHPDGTYRLLWARVRSGRLMALGEVLRAAAAEGYVRRALTELRPLRFAIAMLFYWPMVIALSMTFPAQTALIVGGAFSAPIAAMALLSRSLAGGLYSVIVWNVSTLNMLAGLLRRRKCTTDRIEAIDLTRPSFAEARLQKSGGLTEIVGSEAHGIS